MSYQRLILHYAPDRLTLRGILSTEAVAGCWFELHRQGGCGAGELRLKTDFIKRDLIAPGDWIACEYAAGDRWYLGRVEETQCESPGGLRVLLEGPGIQLNEVFPGSLVPTPEGTRPHFYARQDQFSDDPDREIQSVDFVMNTQELIKKLMQQYVVPQTMIQFNPARIEPGPAANDLSSMKFHGEETVRTVLKDLAMRARNAAWGVDAAGEFFFLQQREEVLLPLREGANLIRLHETRSRELLYNRLMLTGDYIYDKRDNSSQIARRSYRWRGNYRVPDSIAMHGERRIRLWVPWIRTQFDSQSFAHEFFRLYAYPAARYLLETNSQSRLPLPWEGCVEVRDRAGKLLVRMQPETIRVQFDHAPRFRMELGPVDPQELWAEPEHDERWELPDELPSGFGGDEFNDIEPPVPPVDSNGQGNSNSEDESSTNNSSSSGESDTSATSEDSEHSDETSWNSSEIMSSESLWSSSDESSESSADSSELSESSNSSDSGLESSSRHSDQTGSSGSEEQTSELDQSSDMDSSEEKESSLETSSLDEWSESASSSTQYSQTFIT